MLDFVQAQEAMLQAYLSLHSLRNPSRVQSWLHGIVRNVCGVYLREQKAKRRWMDAIHAERLYLDLHQHSYSPGPEELVQQSELDAFVLEQINTLSIQNRSVVLLFYYGHLSVREIADRLEISESAVKNRLHKSRLKLKTLLAPLERPFISSTRRSEQQVQSQPIESHSVEICLIKRINKMIKITSVHIVQTEETENYIVLLLDQPGRRVVPVWVGPSDGLQIMLSLRQAPTVRPWSFNLMNHILNTLGANIQEVQVQPFSDDTLYAIIRVHDGTTIHEFEAPSSDAIALAVHTQSPIVIAEEVMTKVGATLPDSFDELAWLQKESYSLADLETLYGLVNEWTKQENNNIDRFTKRARSTWARAQTEAVRLNHPHVGTEHLLLGMMLDEDGIGTKVLNKLGIAKEQVVAAVEGIDGQEAETASTSSDQPLKFAPRTGKVVQLAAEERRILGHRYIGTEHLLIGLVREDRSAAAYILRDLGLNLNQVRPIVLEHILGGITKVGTRAQAAARGIL